jgi:hypothetical protein
MTPSIWDLFVGLIMENVRYIAVYGFWPMVGLAELADGPTGCGEVARGGCWFAWNLSVTRSTVVTVAERRSRLKMTLLLNQWLALSLPFDNSTGRKPCTALYTVWYVFRLRETETLQNELAVTDLISRTARTSMYWAMKEETVFSLHALSPLRKLHGTFLLKQSHQHQQIFFFTNVGKIALCSSWNI